MQKSSDREWGRSWRRPEWVVSRQIRRASFFLIVCRLFFSPSKALSLNARTAEYTLKLVSLYNFTRFVERPRDSCLEPESPPAKRHLDPVRPPGSLVIRCV
jgi:hypothetical protein